MYSFKSCVDILKLKVSTFYEEGLECVNGHSGFGSEPEDTLQYMPPPRIIPRDHKVTKKSMPMRVV
jgi:hypothetical protein